VCVCVCLCVCVCVCVCVFLIAKCCFVIVKVFIKESYYYFNICYRLMPSITTTQ